MFAQPAEHMHAGPLNSVQHVSLARQEAALVCAGESDIAPVAALLQATFVAVGLLDPGKVLDVKDMSLSRGLYDSRPHESTMSASSCCGVERSVVIAAMRCPYFDHVRVEVCMCCVEVWWIVHCLA